METNFTNMIFTIAIIAIGLIVIAVFLLNLKRKKKEESTQPEQKENPLKNIERIKNEILSLNIFVRENIMSKTIVLKFEELFDLVLEVVEPANDPKNYSPQTVIVNNMSSKYLPKILEGCFSVSNTPETEKKTIDLLNKIKEQLIAIKTSYVSSNQEVFERNSRIMESIFDSYNAKEI